MSGFDIASQRRSPLTATSMPDGVTELPFITQIDLQLDAANQEVTAEAATILGVDLPREPNTVAGGEDLAVLWLGPSEWLIVGPPGHEAALEASLRTALAGTGSSVVDVSANRTTLELRGPHAREILESGCSIDLDPRAFEQGRCAQTLVARAQVVLWQTAPAPDPTYRLLVRPSFAAYLAAWLTDAASSLLDRS
jgi:sarcosine oxidase subunit gamma